MLDDAAFRRQLSRELVRLRERSGLTAAELASACGLPEDRLASYEGGASLPAVGELMNLGRVLGVLVAHFFAAGPPMHGVEVVRAGERWKVSPPTDAAAALNYSYEALAYRLTDKVMSPFHVEIPPSGNRPIEPLSHTGEEFHFILDGLVEVVVGPDAYRLGPGDAIYFDSQLPHTVRALSATPARLLACLVNVRRPPSDTGPLQRQRAG